tara:strand:+ start:232 stop:519 length:288 start_codon:yes stop_codon:yes gene_type:complete
VSEIAALCEVSWRTASRWSKKVDDKEAIKAARHPEEVLINLGVPPAFLASLTKQMRMATCPQCQHEFIVLETVACVTCTECQMSYWRAEAPTEDQ